MLFLSAYILFYVCMYVWLCWVFVSVRGLSLVVASGGHSSLRCGGHSSSRCAGLSLSRPLVAEHRLQTRRLSNCGSRAELLRGMWESSQTRARTRVPCIGRQILNHCATREAPLLFIILFLAALGLRCCTRAFSSCGKWGLLFVVVRGLFMASHCRAQALGTRAQ